MPPSRIPSRNIENVVDGPTLVAFSNEPKGKDMRKAFVGGIVNLGCDRWVLLASLDPAPREEVGDHIRD